MGRDSDDNWDSSSFGDDFSSNWDTDEEDDDLFSDDKMADSWNNSSNVDNSSLRNSSGKAQSSDNNWDEDDGWAEDDDGWGEAPNKNFMASEEIGGTGDIEEQAVEEKNNQIKQVATYGIIASIVVIILVCLVARLRNKATETALNNRVEATQSVKPHSNTNNNQQVANQPVAPVQSSNNGWSKVTYDTSWKFSEPIDGTFTVTAVDTYAKILNNGEVQIKTEVTGSIAGLLGTYSIEIPSEVTSVVNVASMLNVTYQIAESGTNRIVTNIEIK